MSLRPTRRKCRCCSEFFLPDYRNQDRQHYCAKPDCRHASKQASQQRWLRQPANRDKAVALTAEQFRYGFGNALPAEESTDLFERWTVPSPGKPLFEDALANFTPRSPAKVGTSNKTRGPLLLISGGQDHTVPPPVVTATRRLYHKSPAITDFREFADRGHSLTIDHGWHEIAQEALDWLERRVQ